MHNYIIPNRYLGDAKMGNWYEEKCLQEHHFKDYLKTKEQGKLLTTNLQDRVSFCLQPRDVSKAEDGLLHFGHALLLANKVTQGVLSFNPNEKIIGEDAFAVTTSASQAGPALRNVFVIEHLTNPDSKDVVKYGDKFRLVAFLANNIKVYLQSWPLSPQRGSRITRSQEVSVTEAKTSNTIWLFENLNPKKRFEVKGNEVRCNDEVLVKHGLTAQWLAADRNIYLNEFGNEYEVYAKSHTLPNKTQNLFAEKVGHIGVETPLRDQDNQNCWRIVTQQ